MEAYVEQLQKEELVSYYRKHIVEDVMPFWDERCIDKIYGVYLVSGASAIYLFFAVQ